MFRGTTVMGACILAGILVMQGCTTGVDPSPHPGILRVTLKSNESDTSLVILGDTTHFSRYDQFYAWVYGGRAIRGANYVPIYVNTSINRIESDTANLLAREWLDGTPITIHDTVTITPQNSRYRKFTLFEWYLPPGSYDQLEFTLMADEVITFIPKVYVNPIQLPPGTPPQLFFNTPFSIQEDRVTEISIEILPFQSLSRYQDTYLFDRKMQVVAIQTL
jgi:hypothetical protein